MATESGTACEVCASEPATVAVSNGALGVAVRVCDVCSHIVRQDYPLPRNPLPAQLDAAVRRNPYFRQVLHTAATQKVAMTLQPNKTVGWEVHPSNTQYFLIKQGSGVLYTNRGNGNTRRSDATRAELHAGSAWFVDPGEWHDVEASPDGIRMLTTYFPPHHPPNRRDRTREEADAREAGEAGAAPSAIAMLADAAFATRPLGVDRPLSRDAHIAVHELFDMLALSDEASREFVQAMQQRGVGLEPVGDPNQVPSGVNLPRGPHSVFRVVSATVPYRWLVVSSGAPYLQFYAV